MSRATASCNHFKVRTEIIYYRIVINVIVKLASSTQVFFQSSCNFFNSLQLEQLQLALSCTRSSCKLLQVASDAVASCFRVILKLASGCP